MAERIVFSVGFTALTVLLWCSKIPELCAIGIITGCLAFGGWIAVAALIDKKYDK